MNAFFWLATPPLLHWPRALDSATPQSLTCAAALHIQIQEGEEYKKRIQTSSIHPNRNDFFVLMSSDDLCL